LQATLTKEVSVTAKLIKFLVACVLWMEMSGSLLRAQPAVGADSVRTTGKSGLFDQVANALQSSYYQKEFREKQLPAIIEQYRAKADKAETLEDKRRVTHQLLSRIPASHLGLLSKYSYKKMIGELYGKVTPSFGFEIVEFDDMYYAHNVLEGGPADTAGLKVGDRILLIDDRLVDESPRLDWRTDDAYLPDPAICYLICKENDAIVLKVDRGQAKEETIKIVAAPYSAFLAAQASARIIEHKQLKVGYIHFWFIHVSGVAKLLKEKLEGEFAECDAFVLDLRGRGGSAGAIEPIINVLNGDSSTWSRPTIALVDRNSRSAKEVLAYLLQKNEIARIVGQRTAGAVIPASFKSVGPQTMLMFPTFTLGDYTTKLEGIGVMPDVLVEDWRPYRGGTDPIIQAGLDECLLETQRKKNPELKAQQKTARWIRNDKNGLSPRE